MTWAELSEKLTESGCRFETNEFCAIAQFDDELQAMLCREWCGLNNIKFYCADREEQILIFDWRSI